MAWPNNVITGTHRYWAVAVLCQVLDIHISSCLIHRPLVLRARGMCAEK